MQTQQFLFVFALVISGCAVTRDGRVVPLENVLVFQPAGPHPEDWKPPGLQYEDVYFEALDGTRLHGWYCPVNEPRAIVLYLHGNAGNITYLWPDLRLLTERMRVSVLAFDYRGYGRSEGRPTERGLLADARAARRWLADRAGTAEDQIVLYGRSLGGAVAVDLAANDGAKALLLESTFTSLPAVANDLLPLWPGVFMTNRFNSAKKIGNYAGPLVIAHGDADELIPLEQGEQLFAAANEPKQFVRIASGDHNWVPPKHYITELDEFFAAILAAK